MKKKKGTSVFSGRISENAKKRKKGSSYGYLKIPKGIDVFNADPDSKVTMDILPYVVKQKNHPDGVAVGEQWYKRPFQVHRSVGANSDAVVCLASFGKKCPICEYRNKLKKEGGEEEEIKALRPSSRNLYAVILKGKKGDKKIHLFDFSDYLFQERFEEQLSDKDEFETFPDLEEGASIAVRFAENSFGGNKFADPTRFDFVERSEQYDNKMLEEIPSLDDCLSELTYEELRAKFFEIEEEEDEPKKKSDKPVNKKKQDEEEEDEEDEDEDEDEDESLEELIDECDTVEELLGLAKENPDEFKAHLKSLKAITKVKALKKAMLELIEPKEEEEEEEEEEEPAKPAPRKRK